MSEPQPSKSPETNAGEKPATAGGGMASVAAVGARLAELRRTKGWSVDDVSARLKVAAPKLQALEAGDTSQLPGTTFALGLVRSYAKMLGVDPEPFAQALRREKGVPEVDLSMPASAGTDLPRGRVSIPLGGASRGRPWLWAVAAVVVALVAAAMWRTGGDSSNWLARFKSSGAGEAASAAHAQQEGAASDLPASAAVSGTVMQAGALAASATQSVGGASAGDTAAASVPAAGAAPVVASAAADFRRGTTDRGAADRGGRAAARNDGAPGVGGRRGAGPVRCRARERGVGRGVSRRTGARARRRDEAGRGRRAAQGHDRQQGRARIGRFRRQARRSGKILDGSGQCRAFRIALTASAVAGPGTALFPFAPPGRRRAWRNLDLSMQSEAQSPRSSQICSTEPVFGGHAPRRVSHAVDVRWGGTLVTIGGAAPVRVQSMTNTDTADAIGTAIQVKELANAGSELVRITVNTPEAAAAVPAIREQLDRMGVTVPLVGDFHYNGHLLLRDYPDCAQALSKYRINPGNVGQGAKRDSQFAQMIEAAIKYDKPVRIGVNWGSLDQDLLARMMDENGARAEPWEAQSVMYEALIQSAIGSAERAVELGLGRDKIVLSCKVSGVQDLVAVYRELSRRCGFALHLGLTEAGMGSKGIVASTAAIGLLLQEGIGDTIRISLTPEPGAPRTGEVVVGQEILQTMGLRSFAPMVVACPGCGRTTSTLFQELALRIQTYLREQMPVWRSEYPGVEKMNVAVMGCIVNGPGESKHANIGISLPGSGENPAAPVFVDGEKVKTLRGEHIAEEFQQIVSDYVARTYGRAAAQN